MSLTADQRQHIIAAIQVEHDAYANALEEARAFVGITPCKPGPLLAALNALTAATAARQAAVGL